MSKEQRTQSQIQALATAYPSVEKILPHSYSALLEHILRVYLCIHIHFFFYGKITQKKLLCEERERSVVPQDTS